MANYAVAVGFDKNSAGHPAKGNNQITSFATTLDFAKIVAARAAAGATALAAADTLEVIPLPAGSVILSAGLQVVKAETTNTTATFSLGHTGGSPAAANAYAALTPSNALGYAAANLANPTLIGAADTVDLLLNTAVPTDAVIRVFVVVANVAG